MPFLSNIIGYDWLMKITNKQPPYRGTQNRFPLAARSNIRYYFLAETEGDQKVFDICYGYTYKAIPVSAEAAEVIRAKGDTVHAVDGGLMYYERISNRLLRVRPDHTVEFIKDAYAQGERYFLSKFVWGKFTNDSRRGGVIFIDRSRNKIMPIYQGLRLNMDMTTVNDVRVTIYSINRKKSRELVKRYERFFKVSETMLLAITDKDVWAKTVHEIANDHLADLTTVKRRRIIGGERMDFGHESVKDKAHSLMDSSPLDAFVLFGLYYNLHLVRSVADEGKFPQWIYRGYNFESFFNSGKRRIVKDIYKASPEVFVPHTIKAGEHYKPTDWGVYIVDNGVSVEQCGYTPI